MLFAACAAAVALAAWPLKSLTPGVGADFEWVATLSYAAEHGLHYGSQLVWTYGPLGFLETPYGAILYYPDTLVLSWVYEGLLQLLLAGTLLRVLRRAVPLPVAALLAVAVLALQLEVGLALGFAWCVLLVLRDSEDRPAAVGRRLPASVLPLALGALAAIVALGKLNQGVELLMLASVALACAARRGYALAFAAALLLTATIGWAATGQRLADVWPYVRNGLEPIAGYAAAMGQADSSRWSLPLGPLPLGLLLIALAVALAWDVGRGLPRRSRWGLATLCLVYAGFNFKEGFIRQDGLHMVVFFVDLLVLFALLLARAKRRPILLAAMAASGVACGVIMGGHPFVESLNPYANAGAVVDQVQTLASSARQDGVIAGLRQRIAAFYGLPPQFAAAVGAGSVMLWPYAYGDLAYAYGFRLQPLVALEPYATYTARLDRLAAQTLAERGPSRVLRSAPTSIPALDGREVTFEAPRSTLQIFCRYRQQAARQPWQLLVRGSDRCGTRRRLASATAGWGQAVAVPSARRPEALVLVEIDGAGAHGFERVEELALRPRRRWISLDGARYRLIAATAPGGLLLSAPRAADYPAPFGMAPDPSEIAVGRDGGEPGGTLRYTFVEVALSR